jgi:hypothetical protein
MQPPVGSGPKPANPAKAGAITLLVATAAILIGMISKSWATDPDGDIRIGPLGMEACMDSRCVDVPTRGVDEDIQVFMTIAMISGFAAAAAAGVFGAVSLGGRPDASPVPKGLANLFFVVGGLSMAIFLFRMKSENAKMSWAGFSAIGGVVVALVGLQMLAPVIAARRNQGQQPQQPPYPQQPPQAYAQQQPPYAQQPQYPQQPPQQYVAPNCPRCGTQLHFVAQYQRWFCPREQQYI